MTFDDRYMTATEAAAYLRVSLRTLYRYVAAGTIQPSGRTNRGWLFWPDDLDRWVASNVKLQKKMKV